MAFTTTPRDLVTYILDKHAELQEFIDNFHFQVKNLQLRGKKRAVARRIFTASLKKETILFKTSPVSLPSNSSDYFIDLYLRLIPRVFDDNIGAIARIKAELSYQWVFVDYPNINTNLLLSDKDKKAVVEIAKYEALNKAIEHSFLKTLKKMNIPLWEVDPTSILHPDKSSNKTKETKAKTKAKSVQDTTLNMSRNLAIQSIKKLIFKV